MMRFVVTEDTSYKHNIMFFFCTHQIVQNIIPWSKDTKDSRKNITTFIIGALLYTLLVSFLFNKHYSILVNSFFLLFTLKNWILLVLAIDVTAMAVIYKCYYKRSIVDEVSEAFVQERAVDEKSKGLQASAELTSEEPDQAVPEKQHVDEVEKQAEPDKVESPSEASVISEKKEMMKVNPAPEIISVASEHSQD